MRTSRRAFLSIASGLLGASALSRRAAAEDQLGPGQYELGIDRDRDGVLYLPKTYKAGTPMPLLVMFHGAGGTGRGTVSSFELADQHGVIILAPDSRDQRTWDLVLGSYGADADFLALALGRTLQRCSVDRARMLVGGHSDGASYALSFGIGAGDVFTHILAFSPGVMNPVDARGKPRIFISHGTQDTTMPIDDTSRRFVPRLQKLGYDVTYREYAGGHATPPEVNRDGWDWAFGKAD
jgi:phospholipase/carboxylesterase